MTGDRAEHYEGWAPCFHVGEGVSEEQAHVQAQAWLASATNDLERREGDSLVESLLYELSYASVTCMADQWFGVYARSRDFTTYIEADSLALALAETYRVWRDRHPELVKR